jgi:3-hydroxyacyl-CoA dehydrogenase
MGSGIAQKMATQGFDVVLVDLDDDKIPRGVESILRSAEATRGSRPS